MQRLAAVVGQMTPEPGIGMSATQPVVVRVFVGPEPGRPMAPRPDIEAKLSKFLSR